MIEYTTLEVVWFVLLCVCWIAYFVLEGFDFGVGMLLRRIGRDDRERRTVIHTIGPLWDGNEVWLLVAGAGTFAAFPNWYATLFSGAYIALLVVLIALIVRNVAFEFWGKQADARWRRGWEWALVVGSAVPALIWGVAWANIVGGMPIDAQQNYTGTFFDLLGPYALLGGVASLTMFLAHGALFLTMRLKPGAMLDRATAAARALAPVATVVATVFLAWTIADQDGTVVAALCAIGAVVALGAATAVVRGGARRSGAAFAATTAGIALFFATLFTALFPYVLVSSTDPAYSITLHQAASSSYTLTVMTIVTVLLLPLVLLYQGWTLWVFRHRLAPDDLAPAPSAPPAPKAPAGSPGPAT